MIDALGQMLSSPLMQRALVVTVLVGVSAPVIGTYLVQRGMALMGDGIGHVSLTGVAIGWLTAGALNLAPRDVLAVPGAIAASIVGAVLIELVRAHGRTGGDVALAMLFYGGIAGGVLLMGLADSTSANLMRYLFGSVAVVLPEDVLYTAVMAAAILAVGIGLRGPLFALEPGHAHREPGSISVADPAQAWAGPRLVIVEVKTRSSLRQGPPAAAVDARKVARLRALAAAWASTHETPPHAGMRLDVVSILLRDARPALLRHHRAVDASWG